ncbi:MAG TPA: nitrogen fixation protein NifU [Methylocella sp.]|nr:nitrogen fixation protein NifU [Methylocella sp.]
MINGARQDTATLEKTLRRLEDLTAALGSASSPNASEAARELLELVLDLHGLALARLTSVVASAPDGGALTEKMIADPYIGAVLLLHGLHPQDPEVRLREILDRMNLEWAARGFHVDLLGVASASARVHVHKNGTAEDINALRREVEDVLINAAPDLDDILIEGLESGEAMRAAALES